ncbi:SMP-30/gluconolactonase/LRE family protein [Marinicrinis lubricantis]|uniref:Regucalcin n=1 Tax=Marinicrinis lubricantis TaxID=2086470 RepID=A0ABW1IQ76_9BACL
MKNQVELVLDAKAALGEGPCWDHQLQQLYWVDIVGQKVHIYDPAAQADHPIDLPLMAGTVVPRKQGGLVVALQDGFYALDLKTEQLTLLAKPMDEPSPNRFNDGKCDAQGRLWAGTMPLSGSSPNGNLYCLHADLQVKHHLGGIGTSNGLAWSADQKTMYYIDTPTKQVFAFDFDLAEGTITNRRTVISFMEEEGFPDGMTIDANGMLWIAHWGGYQVSRWNPQTGEKLESVKVPARQVTSCTFGGEQLDELYITTARIGIDEAGLLEQPHAGGLFKYKPGVRGMISYAFEG